MDLPGCCLATDNKTFSQPCILHAVRSLYVCRTNAYPTHSSPNDQPVDSPFLDVDRDAEAVRVLDDPDVPLERRRQRRDQLLARLDLLEASGDHGGGVAADQALVRHGDGAGGGIVVVFNRGRTEIRDNNAVTSTERSLNTCKFRRRLDHLRAKVVPLCVKAISNDSGQWIRKCGNKGFNSGFATTMKSTRI